MEGRLGAAPEYDLDLVEQGARREADRKGLEIKIERAAGVEDARHRRTASDDADLAMRDVDEAMSGSVQHRLQHAADIWGVIRDQQPFVRAEPQSRASCSLARWTES